MSSNTSTHADFVHNIVKTKHYNSVRNIQNKYDIFESRTMPVNSLVFTEIDKVHGHYCSCIKKN